MPAVDHQVLTRDIAGNLRAQKYTQPRHFLGTAEAVHRNPPHQALQELLISETDGSRAFLEKRLVVPARIDEAGRNGIHGDAERGELIGEAATQAEPRGSRGVRQDVIEAEGRAAPRESGMTRPDGDDATPPLGLHAWHDGAGEMGKALDHIGIGAIEVRVTEVVELSRRR